MEFGIAAFGSALGKRTAVADVVHDYTEDTARVLGQGYHAIHVAGQDVGLTDLAVDAAASALADAGVTADEVDLVVLAITDIPEHLYWDASAALAHRLRATRAEAVLVDQGCIGGITALDLVAGRLATHPDYETALVVGANRTCEQYWNRLETHSLLFSDGAVLQRDRPLPVWGQAAPGAQVQVEFDGRRAQAVAASDGRWSLSLPAHAASRSPLTFGNATRRSATARRFRPRGSSCGCGKARTAKCGA